MDKRLMDSKDINLKISNYNELFSYFDARNYNNRSLSYDLLSELRRAARDKKENFKLVINVNKKDKKSEKIIGKRMNDHFKRHYLMLRHERNMHIKNGLLLTILGIIFMIFATFVLFYSDEKTFVNGLLVVILEPAGWFLFWEGLYLVIFDAKNSTPDLGFYKKMSKCKIVFV